MSVQNFFPSIWSANLIHFLQKEHVAVSVSNREYEGEVKSGGSEVRISQFGAVTVNNYTRNNWATGLTIQTLDDAQQILKIDQEKYFALGYP